jgi:beta-phosphoglucomutase-like phosphatase (HAD superfamily)
MKKLLMCDLDGTLADTAEIRYEALKAAMTKLYPARIPDKGDYDKFFNGVALHTILKELDVPEKLHGTIYTTRNTFLKKLAAKFERDTGLIYLFNEVRPRLVHISCCTNAPRAYALTLLEQLGVFEFFDSVYGHEDHGHPKPNPEIFLRCMADTGIGPKDSLILEDSKIGIMAAEAACCDYVELTRDKLVERMPLILEKLGGTQ